MAQAALGWMIVSQLPLSIWKPQIKAQMAITVSTRISYGENF